MLIQCNSPEERFVLDNGQHEYRPESEYIMTFLNENLPNQLTILLLT